jgi:hypothetical protein
MTMSKQQLRASMVWQWLADRPEYGHVITDISTGVGLPHLETLNLLNALECDGRVEMTRGNRGRGACLWHAAAWPTCSNGGSR